MNVKQADGLTDMLKKHAQIGTSAQAA